MKYSIPKNYDNKFEKDNSIMNNINSVYLSLYNHLKDNGDVSYYLLDASLSIEKLSKIIRKHFMIF